MTGASSVHFHFPGRCLRTFRHARPESFAFFFGLPAHSPTNPLTFSSLLALARLQPSSLSRLALLFPSRLSQNWPFRLPHPFTRSLFSPYVMSAPLLRASCLFQLNSTLPRKFDGTPLVLMLLRASCLFQPRALGLGWPPTSESHRRKNPPSVTFLASFLSLNHPGRPTARPLASTPPREPHFPPFLTPF